MDKLRVLFLCTGNSCRSQMAEAFLRHYAGDCFEPHSAGLEPKAIHPLTRQVLAEQGIDMTGQVSKGVRVYLGRTLFTYLVTVCADAEAKCPTTFLGVSKRLHWAFDDPAAFDGTEAEKLQKFREVRDQISRQIQAFVAETAVAA